MCCNIVFCFKLFCFVLNGLWLKLKISVCNNKFICMLCCCCCDGGCKPVISLLQLQQQQWKQKWGTQRIRTICAAVAWTAPWNGDRILHCHHMHPPQRWARVTHLYFLCSSFLPSLLTVPHCGYWLKALGDQVSHLAETLMFWFSFSLCMYFVFSFACWSYVFSLTCSYCC